tara:strand:+ start:4557 stop:4679 length:123 start_codon:yes stop_codon:yes gene_type:complete
MSKGSKPRPVDKKAYDACPLWANIDKKKNHLPDVKQMVRK